MSQWWWPFDDYRYALSYPLPMTNECIYIRVIEKPKVGLVYEFSLPKSSGRSMPDASHLPEEYHDAWLPGKARKEVFAPVPSVDETKACRPVDIPQFAFKRTRS
jgi:hypothetical protein